MGIKTTAVPKHMENLMKNKTQICPLNINENLDSLDKILWND